ncbi:MAG: ABC transporter ATP-binding protein [Candidatus Thermoplasmatota archaeon]|nr:ABC transporter ATP-binding protein [Candidatus Thermoplasmatota archaeon]MBS3789948.1 ABC transporter ATP-binding protein [Candidatus Thermoplasmatota archaeon]
MKTKDLYFKYPRSERYAIESVNLDFKDKKITGVMGENGSGKTTLLRLLARFIEPTEGKIEFGDQEIGFSPEDPELGFFEKDVESEIGFYPKNRGLDQEKMTKKVLEQLDISHLKEKLPFILSSGQQRLVSLASVLSGDPDVIILDEPTHSLHKKGEEKIGEVLKKINKTIIFSTHSSEFALDYADEIIVMHEGKVLAEGKPRKILKDKDLLEKAGIRMPEIIRWAKERSLQTIPKDMNEALKIAKERGELD